MENSCTAVNPAKRRTCNDGREVANAMYREYHYAVNGANPKDQITMGGSGSDCLLVSRFVRLETS